MSEMTIGSQNQLQSTTGSDAPDRLMSIKANDADHLPELLLSLREGDFLSVDIDNHLIRIKHASPRDTARHNISYGTGRVLRPFIGWRIQTMLDQVRGDYTEEKLKARGRNGELVRTFKSAFHDPRRVLKSVMLHSLNIDTNRAGYEVDRIRTSKSPISWIMSLRISKAPTGGKAYRIGRVTHDDIKTAALDSIANRYGSELREQVRNLELKDLLRPKPNLRKEFALHVLQKSPTFANRNPEFLKFVAQQAAAQTTNFMDLADLLDMLDTRVMDAKLSEQQTACAKENNTIVLRAARAVKEKFRDKFPEKADDKLRRRTQEIESWNNHRITDLTTKKNEGAALLRRWENDFQTASDDSGLLQTDSSSTGTVASANATRRRIPVPRYIPRTAPVPQQNQATTEDSVELSTEVVNGGSRGTPESHAVGADTTEQQLEQIDLEQQ